LHEVGHHLALGPRLPFNLSLACECVADNWAVREGANILHERSGRPLRVAKAIEELDRFMCAEEHTASYPAERSSPCLNRTWSERKSALKSLQVDCSILQTFGSSH
jgi:hypothetical protein